MLKLNNLIIAVGLISSFFFSLAPVTSASAVSPSEWKPGRIIDDTVFNNKNGMSISQIQQFLESKMPTCDTYGNVGGGWRKTYAPNNPPPFTCLKDYKEVPKTTPGNWIPESNYGRTDGWAPAGSKSAAEIIWDAAQAHNINPKVLLVTLQKESSLVTDDWPLKRQLVYAMGAYCPDSGPGGSANCNVNYSGFSMQMHESAELFRYYINSMDQPWWTNKKPYRNNTIQYHPNTGCGSNSIMLESRATTALYVYTPYQPNTSALNAGYGEGDGCSAYGNRNFWLFYNDWFGSPLDRSFQLVKSSTSSSQYVTYNGLKQLIPSTEVKIAWGLDTTPIETVDQAYINSLTNGPNLDTVFRINGSTQLYLADSGKRYAIPSVDAWKAWKLDTKAISNVPTGLGITPADGGILSYTLRQTGQTSVYMLDGLDNAGSSILRRYSNPDVLYGIEGANVPVMTVSNMLFSSINTTIKEDLTSTKVAHGSSEYQLVSGQKLPQSALIAPLYPGVANHISDISFNRFVSSSPATPFVRASNAPEIYIVQNGKKQYINSPEILSHWTRAQSEINVVNQNYINLLPTDPAVLSTTISTTPQGTYIIDRGTKTLIPDRFAAAYRTKGFSMSTQLGATLIDRQRTVNRFVHDASTKQIFMMNDSSVLIPLPSVEVAELWGVNANNTVSLPKDTIRHYDKSSTILQAHVSNGTNTYLLSSGQLHEFDNSQWKLTNPLLFTDGTLTSISVGNALVSGSKSSTEHHKIINGTAYLTTDEKIAQSWGITKETADISRLIKVIKPELQMLTPVILHDNNYYIADNTVLYKTSPLLYANLSLSYPTMNINPAETTLEQKEWLNPLFTNTAGGSYVIDNGALRTFGHSLIHSHWMNGINTAPPVVSNNFISMFKPGQPIERAIKTGSSPAIYSAEGAKKRWILSTQSYREMYAPYTIVSNQLLSAMEAGEQIP